MLPSCSFAKKVEDGRKMWYTPEDEFPHLVQAQKCRIPEQGR